MSLVFEYQCLVKSISNINDTRDIIYNIDYKNNHKHTDVEIVKQTNSEIFFRISGHRCDEYWEDIQPLISNNKPDEWLFITYCDMDGNYKINGNLGDGEFTAEINYSKSLRKHHEEIAESPRAPELTIEKIQNKDIKIKYI